MIFKDVGTIMPVWQIHRVDPGFIYIIESHSRYKIGKTKRTKDRLKTAKTWLPDMRLIGFKPFWGVSHHERQLHTGFARYWYAQEWFNFEGDSGVRGLLLDGFAAFSDDNPDRNSVDFIYWFNGEGMAEFLIEMDRQKLSLPKFQKRESFSQKRRD
ncbi:GIY-YIG nuclease family protein [Mesorhizobium captivum]|uniref:GIY-YIG nuclease family protein n=1 Tax=Mesorhizobium captivum TaxID=3072319 RepID=UPI002A241038|nr:GIY-YIG nuclease family protein [Mesorhizobium sp. VK23E]MDX8514985.1 GIY-YIG nuclease family protein [Mesorhizobium sp. VK23E]